MSHRRPRIVHVIDRLALGGMESVALTLIERTAEVYDHHIVCLRDAGPQAERAEAAGVSVTALDKQPGKDPRAYLRLRSMLRSLAPAVVHTYNIGTLDVAIWARSAGVRRIVHAEHGRDAADPDGRNRKYRWLRRLMAPFISAFVPVSGDLAQWMRADLGLPADKIHLIRNGIDTTRFKAGPALRESGSFAPWPAEARVIGTIGRLDPVKGFDTLISAFAQLHARSAVPLRLVIIGDGPERDALAAQVRSLGLEEAVWLAGARDDTPTLLNGMAVYVCASIAEGIALTMLEAMACERPIVATRVGGNPELVDDGTHGLLVPSGAPAAMAEAIETLLAEPDRAAALGAAARTRIVADFSVAAMVAGYRRLYDDLLLN
ncbi:glycosyltransferase [Salinisphaera sp. Q1T1-3]|uniref:glycosyltransferase n=1 Tax=Salinisphaera sp. Q1T1-3 TaxID=2321229 RepID=UPI000E7153CD|nr:glycosyltransferase [Salinisphaera sp. Q1T1-3]RJS94723.1 glycosyltransferase [Salinisphaera sp. Q1T1-3]